jgi:hypothetical protein
MVDIIKAPNKLFIGCKSIVVSLILLIFNYPTRAFADSPQEYSESCQAQAQESAAAAGASVMRVKQPTRVLGDMTAAQADLAANEAQVCLERVETDIAAHSNWQNDLSSARKAINDAIQLAHQAADVARANGAFFGGGINSANDTAADNCEAAAALASKAISGNSDLSEAQAAATAYTQAGNIAMGSGFPVAAHEDYAAANIARIVAKWSTVNSAINNTTPLKNTATTSTSAQGFSQSTSLSNNGVKTYIWYSTPRSQSSQASSAKATPLIITHSPTRSTITTNSAGGAYLKVLGKVLNQSTQIDK